MRQIVIDCAGITGAEQLHDALSKALGFPQWYGRNLDALYDCLTGIGEETELTLVNFQELGIYRNAFAWVMEDAVQANARLHIHTVQEETSHEETL